MNTSLLIAFAIGGFGALCAWVSIFVAYRLTPPIHAGTAASASAVEQVGLAGAILQAEQERREEIDSLRQIMLKQRIEIAQLQNKGRQLRPEEIRGRRAQELERRRRRSDCEARRQFGTFSSAL